MRRWAPPRRALLLLVTPLVVAAIAAAVYRETRPRERDRHAVLNEVHAVERAIRTHDQTIWLRVEGQHGTSDRRAGEAAHSQMLKDFDRLGHLVDFRMEELDVDLRGEIAVVTYAISGKPRPGERPEPGRGELHLRRQSSGRWLLVSHRLFEGG